MEPPCRICTRFVPPAAFDPRILESRYKSPVTRRRVYYDPRRCNAKVGTDSKSELDSYNVDRIVNKIEELNRNIQHLSRSRRHDEAIEPKGPAALSDVRMIDLETANNTVEKCLEEMRKIKMFLKDENAWWKILKRRSMHCCQQKLPHLHGMLDGSLVTLLMFEDETNETPRRFVTAVTKKESDVPIAHSSEEFVNEIRNEQQASSWKGHKEKETDFYAVPHYSLDVNSAVIEIANTNGHNSTQRYVKEVVRMKRNSNVSESWAEVQDKGGSNTQKIPESTFKSKKIHDADNTQDKKDKENKNDESNIAPSRETSQNIQTTFEGTLKSQEPLSSENTEGKKNATADFGLNVNLTRELSSKNMPNYLRKPRTKTMNETNVCPARKLLTKISKTKNKN